MSSAALNTNVDRKLLAKTKFPDEFKQKVDMQKVNVPVIQKWIADEISKIMGDEDDILTETIYNYLDTQFVGHLSGFNAVRWEEQRLISLSFAAQDQGTTDPNHWIPGQRSCAFREDAVEAFAVCTELSGRCP